MLRPAHPPIALWYHCWLMGPSSDDIATEQMAAMEDCGLFQECDTAQVWGLNARSELETLARLQQWIPGHEQFLVCYLHTKGAQYAVDTYGRWRRCMERVVLWGWRDCVQSLMDGADTAGAHWMTSKKYPIVGWDQRYWGGNFWWATARYLSTLPPINPDAGRYEAEVWIGKSPVAPKIVDFAPHFPQNQCP